VACSRVKFTFAEFLCVIAVRTGGGVGDDVSICELKSTAGTIKTVSTLVVLTVIFNPIEDIYRFKSVPSFHACI
jgi:hypothetical protein